MDPHGSAGASAIVLAGGRSSRMGRPKALLPFDDRPLVLHIVEQLRSLCGDVVVVGSPEQDLPELPATLVRDAVAYQGPVSGLCSGLAAIRSDVAIAVACDSAFLSLPLLAHLLEESRDHDVVVPWWQGRWQPLHAAYRKSVLPLLEQQLARGEMRPVALFDKVRTRRVDEEEIRRFDPDGWSFFNMNTPEEYATAVDRWKTMQGQPPAGERIDCTVELFGVARLLAHVHEVPLDLPVDATLSDVFDALAARLPMLVGRVIHPDRTRLVEGYACNINGLAFARTPAARVAPGDHVVILAADAGG